MKKIAIAALLSSLVSVPAVAADFYAGIKLGQTKYSYSNLTKNNPTGLGILGGYTINNNFAIEAEYTDLGNLAAAGLTATNTAFSISAVGSYPINDQFSVFGKLGIARATMKQTPAYTAKNTSATYGLGGQYNASQSVGIRLGWDRYKIGDAITNTANADIYSVAGVFKF
ncbi:MAG: porin family protein [Nitrosomonadales bacterium]|nr:porin family protein [Nitrosomonadales bacterium]